MIVLSLFDGQSCGQIALNELGVKVDKYYASEIDKHAIKQTMLNFPDTIQLGSVTDVDVSKLDKIDLLIGGSPCFAAGTKVLTIDGYKNIEDIVVGDMVLTHKNRFMPVLRVGGKVETTFTLKAQGFVDVICTKNHPFYARKKMFEYYKQSNGRNSRRMFLGDPEWVEAGDLKDDYYVCSNIQNGKCENKLNITDDEAYIIGRYIADGHTRKDLRYDYKKNGNKGHNGSRSWQLILSIGNHKVDAFCSNIKNTHYSCYKHGDSVHRIVFSNKRLVEIAEKLCGIGSVNKHFGEPIINLPNELLAIVLKGFLDGDGYFDGKNWNITTTSPILAMSISRVVSKLYGRHSNISFQKTNEYGKIMGRVVHLNDQYVIIFSENKVEKEKPKVIEDKIWSGVKSFKQNKIQKVYNIEVEEDNSYTANNFVVHNCTNFSFAGKRNGMSTTTNEEIYTLERYLELKNNGFEFEGESFLFWEYMRILRDSKPNYFLLENVEMGEKWETTLSEAIGIRPVHINSALVSAQNRRRLYWVGQIRERLYYSENYCCLCGNEKYKKNENRRVQEESQRKGTAKVLGNSQKRYVYLQSMPKRVFKSKSGRDNKNLFGGMSIDQQKNQRQKQESDNQKSIHEEVLSGKQTGASEISIRIQENKCRERNYAKGRFKTISSKEGEIQSIQGNKSSKKQEDFRDNKYIESKTDMCCVQCGKGLDHRPRYSFVEGWKKYEGKSPSSLSKVQFDEIKQNDGRVYDIIPIGVQGLDSLFGDTINPIPQPEDRGILLKDILEEGVDEKYYLSDRTTGSPTEQRLEPGNDGKTNTLTTVQKDNLVLQINPSKESGGKQPYQHNRVYDTNGISPCLNTDARAPAILTIEDYKILVPEATAKGYVELSPGECFDFENPKSKTRRGRKMIEKSNSLMSQNMSFMNYTSDYRIRRLTPTECSRLQTIPEWYRWECSDTQAYRMLGNGWTVEVIKHILNFIEL